MQVVGYNRIDKERPWMTKKGIVEELGEDYHK